MALNPLSEQVCRPRPDGPRLVLSKGLLDDGAGADVDRRRPGIELRRWSDETTLRSALKEQEFRFYRRP
jgi:hypothetical protein